MSVLLVDAANVVGSRPTGWWRDRAGAMARLHGEDRYNRSTHDVESVTGHGAQTVRQYVEQHRDMFS